MAHLTLKLLLVALALGSASAFTCNDRVKPGQVTSVWLASTGYYNGFSSMDFEWSRPNDKDSTGSLSCIKEYDFALFRMDGQQIVSARIPVTLDATGARYQARGLNPGTQYKVAVSAVGPSQGNGASSGQRGPFTSAPSSSCDDNKKPGQVSTSNIRLMSTAVTGNGFSSINWEWDRPNDGTPLSCINGYDVAVFTEDGRQFISANVPVDPSHTKGYYEAKGLSSGNRYWISVTARGPKQGNGAPGMKAGPFAAAGAINPPTCPTPAAVTNVRKESAAATGANQITMTMAWDAPADPNKCIKEYSVQVIDPMSNTVLKVATVYHPTTRYTDSLYQPGKMYDFTIFARTATGLNGPAVRVGGFGASPQPRVANEQGR